MNNERVTVYPSLSRDAATYNADFINPDGNGLDLIIDVTDVGAGPGTVTVTIEGVDPASGKKYTILASAVINATGTTILRVGRGLTASANVVANSHIPKKVNVKAVVATNAVVFSVGANLIH